MSGNARPDRGCTPARRRQRGSATLLVLVLLSLMLAGALALARITEVSALAGGNLVSNDTAMQASEVGLNTAFAAVQNLADENAATGNWYWPTTLSTNATGIPDVAWDSAPVLTVGQYRVAYAVDRLCSVAPVTDALRQCLLRQVVLTESSREGAERPDPPSSRQFRITVRVLGPKSTEVWTQAMVTRGT